MQPFKVGDKVTVSTTIADPTHLSVNPHTEVVEVRYDTEGPVYYVGHPAAGSFAATRFGPYAPERLKAGW